MLAMKEAEQLAALDREARTEAMIENYEADNERADRNTDRLIEDRRERTRVAGRRADVSDRRETRLGNRPQAQGRAGGGSGGAPKTAVSPQTGERLEQRVGKWVLAGPRGQPATPSGGFRCWP